MKPTHSVEWRKQVEPYRLLNVGMWSSPKQASFGAFNIPHPTEQGVFLRCIVGDEDWDHISISLGRPDKKESLKRCPTWDEMCYVKGLFFLPDELVIQFHPPKSDYVNLHPFVLHLWRPQKEKIPLPPKAFV